MIVTVVPIVSYRIVGHGTGRPDFAVAVQDIGVVALLALSDGFTTVEGHTRARRKGIMGKASRAVRLQCTFSWCVSSMMRDGCLNNSLMCLLI